MSKTPRKILLAIVAAGLLVLVLYKLRGSVHLSGFRWSLLLTLPAQANLWLLLLSVATIYLCYAIRALRWTCFARTIGPATFRNIFPSTLMGFTCVFLLGRVGEPIRPMLIARKDKLPLAGTFGIYVLERIFDLSATAVAAGIAFLVIGKGVALRPESAPLLAHARHAGAVLLVGAVALFLLYESAMRLRHPAPVQAEWMMWIAALALVVNGGITLALLGGHRDLNVRSVLVHSLGDAASSAGILAGALVIHWTGAVWVDPALGLGIGLLVLWSATGILRESSHILLEGLPRHLRLEDVATELLGVEGVQEVHDVHIWTLGTDSQALSCHVRIPDMHMEDSEKILERVQQVLSAKFQITHITVQLERAGLPKEAGFFMPEPLAPSKTE